MSDAKPVTTTMEEQPESLASPKEDPIDPEAGGIKEQKLTYAATAKANGMRYTITDVPPMHLCILFGIQHYMTMLGATVLIPLIVTPAMGATSDQTAEVISTIFFVSGLNTLVQTTLGDRLPIVQGGSFAYLSATFSIIFNPSLQAIEDPNERFLQTMRTIQGAVIVAGICQMTVGYSGLVVPVLRFISPVIIAPVIAAVGFSLYAVAWQNISLCFSMGLTQMLAIIICSQYLKKVKFGGYPIFAMFPIIIAITFTWSLNAILTASDVWDDGGDYATCRTDSSLVKDVPWFRIPYPGQWGAPIFKAFAILPMLGGAMAGMVESIGDYYSCAKLSGAPPPTPGIVSRGLAAEGIGVFMAGLFGSGNGTTSYSENIGALSLTRVGSRAVIQCGAVVMMIVSVVAKVGALFATLPAGIVGGIYACVFGLIVAVGLSNLQYVDLNSERNLFIIGFSILNCLSIAGPGGYFASQTDNPFGTTTAAEVALAFFSSPIIIAMLASFILDNTIAGTAEERGMHIWEQVRDADVNNDPEYIAVYSLPLVFARLFRNCGYLEYASRGAFPPEPLNGYQSGRGDLGDLCCPCFMTTRPDHAGDADDNAVYYEGSKEDGVLADAE
jgi:solute carrier family 23 (nucleobase transporter), member 1